MIMYRRVSLGLMVSSVVDGCLRISRRRRRRRQRVRMRLTGTGKPSEVMRRLRLMR